MNTTAAAPLCPECETPLSGRQTRFCGRACALENLDRRNRSTEARQKLSTARRGSNNPHWRGGVVTDGDGYVRVRIEADHPFAGEMGYDTGGTLYVKRSRLTMAEAMGRPLESHEHVHHTHDRQDDRLENLVLLPSRGAHTKLEALQRRLEQEWAGIRRQLTRSRMTASHRPAREAPSRRGRY